MNSAQIVELVKRMIGVCVTAPGLIPVLKSTVSLSSVRTSHPVDAGSMTMNIICIILINMAITVCNWRF